jgi:intracellular septation protein
MNPQPKSNMNPWLRFALDFGPLLLFFATSKFFNLYAATAVIMAAIAVALAIEYIFERRVSPILLFTAILVLIMGGLTLYLKNDIFIKMKPTVLYAFFGALLLGGLAFERLFIKHAFARLFELTDEGWRKLTLRWGFFALFLAVLNEIVWRNFSTAIWVDFKVWGIAALFFLFAMAQTPLIGRHQIESETSPLDPSQEL